MRSDGIHASSGPSPRAGWPTTRSICPSHRPRARQRGARAHARGAATRSTTPSRIPWPAGWSRSTSPMAGAVICFEAPANTGARREDRGRAEPRPPARSRAGARRGLRAVGRQRRRQRARWARRRAVGRRSARRSTSAARAARQAAGRPVDRRSRRDRADAAAGSDGRESGVGDRRAATTDRGRDPSRAPDPSATRAASPSSRP